jgi:hypothetical protein
MLLSGQNCQFPRERYSHAAIRVDDVVSVDVFVNIGEVDNG